MLSVRPASFALLGAAVFLTSCNQSAPNSDVLGEAPKSKTELVEAKAQDGPFGLRIGQPISDLSYAETGGEAGVYSLTSVPKPMAEIDTYAVVAFPDTGICEIRAASKDFDSDAYGVNVKAAIEIGRASCRERVFASV